MKFFSILSLSLSLSYIFIGGSSNVEVLFATSWIIGEYASLLMRTNDDDDVSELSQEEAEEIALKRNEDTSLHKEISMAMLQSRNLTLPMLVQCALVHNSLKVVLAGLNVAKLVDEKALIEADAVSAAEKMANDVVDALEVFTESKHVEVSKYCMIRCLLL